MPTIDDLHNAGKTEATQILEELVSGGNLFSWIVSEVGYDPSPVVFDKKLKTLIREGDKTGHLKPLKSQIETLKNIEWHGTIPKNRKDLIVLRRILGRTQGYCGNVERDLPKHNNTSKLLFWMCRDNQNTEQWKTLARNIFAEIIVSEITCPQLPLLAKTSLSGIGKEASESAIGEFSKTLKKEFSQAKHKSETVQTWDFFFEKLIEKTVEFPKSIRDVDWDYIADYFLMGTTYSTQGNEIARNIEIRYESKYFNS